MEFQDVIYGRRTVRNFIEKPVEMEKIYEIIKGAIHAPSASNKQAWRYIIIDDNEIKAKLCSLNGSVIKAGAEIILKAPIGIVVLYRNDVSKNYIQYKDTIQSAAAAIENLQLTAFNLGLGTCWICKLPIQKTVRKLLSIPKEYDVIAYVALGYPKKELDEHTVKHFKNNAIDAERRIRKYTVEDVISYNAFKENEKEYETYKNVKLACYLQNLQLKMNESENKSMKYKIIKRLLIYLGEKWI